MKIEKGSKEWMFWQDFYRFRQEYYSASTDEEFQNLVDKAKVVTDNYVPYLGEFARQIVLAHIEDVERRWKDGRKEM